MDFLATVFLESPARLGVFCFGALAACLLIRRRLEGPARGRIVPITLAAMVALFVIQSLVDTPREQVVAALKRFVNAIEQKNAAAIADAISDDYAAEGWTRDDVVKFIRGRLARLRIYDSRLAPTVRVEDGTARMALGARATVSVDGGVGEFHVGSWRIDWRHEAGGHNGTSRGSADTWRITALRPERLDGIEINSMRDLAGHGP